MLYFHINYRNWLEKMGKIRRIVAIKRLNLVVEYFSYRIWRKRRRKKLLKKRFFCSTRSNSRGELILRSMFTRANLILRQWLSLLSFKSINIHSDLWACYGQATAATATTTATAATTTISWRRGKLHTYIENVQFKRTNKKKKRITRMLKETVQDSYVSGIWSFWFTVAGAIQTNRS